MQSVSSLVNRAVLVVAGALALGACNRADYAMLPKSPAYLGTKSVAVAPRPVAQPQLAPEVAAAPATSAPLAPVPSPAAPVAKAPARPVAVAPVKAAPTVAPVATEAPVTMPAPAVAAEAKPAAPKLNLVQRLALKKISKKLEKLAANSPQLKQREATASTSRVGGNLRTALVLGVVGLILTILGGIAGIFYVIGVILLLIALVFLLLWVLDEA